MRGMAEEFRAQVGGDRRAKRRSCALWLDIVRLCVHSFNESFSFVTWRFVFSDSWRVRVRGRQATRRNLSRGFIAFLKALGAKDIPTSTRSFVRNGRWPVWSDRGDAASTIIIPWMTSRTASQSRPAARISSRQVTAPHSQSYFNMNR